MPAYECSLSSDRDRKHWVAARSPEEAVTKAVTKLSASNRDDVIVQQDEDVLDTWFSSALLPFSVFGWPEKVFIGCEMQNNGCNYFGDLLTTLSNTVPNKPHFQLFYKTTLYYFLNKVISL